MNIGTTLMRNANRIPDKLAFKFGPKTYTYKEMNEYVNRLANGLLARGIDKGDKIGIMMKNSDLFVMAFYAIMKAGAVAVPINFRLTEREVEYILKDSDSVALFFDVVTTGDRAAHLFGFALDALDGALDGLFGSAVLVCHESSHCRVPARRIKLSNNRIGFQAARLVSLR